MAWYECLALAFVLAGLVAFLAYEIYQESVRHKAWLAERKAQTELYTALLDEIRKAR